MTKDELARCEHNASYALAYTAEGNTSMHHCTPLSGCTPRSHDRLGNEQPWKSSIGLCGHSADSTPYTSIMQLAVAIIQ
jgi:hypothetical protein